MADTLPLLLPRRPLHEGRWKPIPAARFYTLVSVALPPSLVNRELGYTEWNSVSAHGFTPHLARVLEGPHAGFYEWVGQPTEDDAR